VVSPTALRRPVLTGAGLAQPKSASDEWVSF